MRGALAVLTLTVALALVAPMAWASENVDHPALPPLDHPLTVIPAGTSDSDVAGPSVAPSLPYADQREENVEH